MEHRKVKLSINSFNDSPIQIGVNPEEVGGYYVEDRETRGTIAIVPDFYNESRNAQANAARLALCWNSYDELVEVAQEAFNILSRPRNCFDCAIVCKKIEKILAATRGEK